MPSVPSLVDLLSPELITPGNLSLDEIDHLTTALLQVTKAIGKFESDHDLEYLLDLLDSIPEFNLDEWTDNVTEEIELYL
jgi:hypothetical protein